MTTNDDLPAHHGMDKCGTCGHYFLLHGPRARQGYDPKCAARDGTCKCPIFGEQQEVTES